LYLEKIVDVHEVFEVIVTVLLLVVSWLKDNVFALHSHQFSLLPFCDFQLEECL